MKRPAPPSHTHRTSGFTLVELMIGTALLVLLFATVTVMVTRSAQASRASSIAASTNASMTKLGEQLGSELSTGQVILRSASKQRLDLLRLGRAVPVTLADGATRKNTYSLKLKGNGLSALVGQPVVVVGSAGDYMVTRVTNVVPSGGTSQAVFSCLMSVPGNLTVYPFNSLSLEQSGGLKRTLDGVGQVVGSNVRSVTFEPVYGKTSWVFGSTPASPASHYDNQRLSAINYALTSTDEQPVTSAGTARLNLAAFNEWGCTVNPSSPKNNLGKLQVNVLYNGSTTGPSGVVPGVGVSGPGMSQNITAWTRRAFENLDAGTYSVSAPSIPSGELLYDATVTGSPASVGNGRQGTVNVNYLIRKGKVNVAISGLPSPGPASSTVNFSGPDSTSLPAQNGTRQLELTPGDYSVSAGPVGDYEAEISDPSLHVTSLTNKTITVTYAVPKGDINLQITGLPTPPPATGYVRVNGPESKVVAAQTGSTTLNVKKGSYTVTADQIGEYEPSVSTSSVTVGKNTSTTVTVSYALPKGPLSVEVQGLPAGTAVPVSVSGPESTSLNVPSGSKATASLKQGTYSVSAPEMSVGGTTYIPSPANATVTLGKSGANHVVTYAAGGAGGTPGSGGGTSTGTPGGEGGLPGGLAVVRVQVSYSDQTPTKIRLTNVDSGQSYSADVQAFAGFPAGSVKMLGADGEYHKYTWAAKPANTMIGEFKLPPGNYRFEAPYHKGNGYSMISMGYQVDHVDGLTVLSGGTGTSSDLNFLKGVLSTYKSLIVNSVLSIRPGTYNVVTGTHPSSGLGSGMAAGGQFMNVECSALEKLIVEYGCVDQ